jgi:hypothetical protein
MQIIGASDRFMRLFRSPARLTEADKQGCQHVHVLHGGGAHFGDDLVTCVDCGLEKYEEAFPRTRQSQLRKRPLGPRGVYEPVTLEQWEKARPATDKDAPLFGACSQ